MIRETDCEFVPSYASPGKILRGDGDFIIRSSQLGLDPSVPYNRCILPRKIDFTLSSGKERVYTFAGKSFRMTDITTGAVEFSHWVYMPDDSVNINLHVLHG